MSRKSRKIKAKVRARTTPHVSHKELEERTRIQSFPSKSVPVVKPTTRSGQPELYRYALSDIKLSGIIGGALIALLVILYFIFR